MFSLYLLTKNKALEKLYILSYFESASTDSPWLYLIHLLKLMPQLIFEQSSLWEESDVCRLLPNIFQIFKILLVYFWSPNLVLDPANDIFHLKSTITDLKSCTELSQ